MGNDCKKLCFQEADENEFTFSQKLPRRRSNPESQAEGEKESKRQVKNQNHMTNEESASKLDEDHLSRKNHSSQNFAVIELKGKNSFNEYTEDERKTANEEQMRKYARLMEEEKELMKLHFQEDKEARLRLCDSDASEPHEVKVQCPICVAEIEVEQMGLLECGHLFHVACVNYHIKAGLEAYLTNILCPMEECDRKISEADIREFTDGTLLTKFNEHSFQHYIEANKDTSWCPSAGCQAVFVYDAEVSRYSCPTCKKQYCLKCKCSYHADMTCAEYRISSTYSEADKKFDNFIKGAKFKQCPGCNFWVERSTGCDHMTCRCGKEFCYKCGKNYPHTGKCA